MPGEVRIVLTSPDGALVRLPPPSLTLPPLPVHGLDDGIGVVEPCRPAPVSTVAERHMPGCARRSHLCTIELDRSYTLADMRPCALSNAIQRRPRPQMCR